MSVHIFSVNEENYKICIQHGLVGLPEPKDNKNNILLMFGNMKKSTIASYDIIEVKCDEFDSKALTQLILEPIM